MGVVRKVFGASSIVFLSVNRWKQDIGAEEAFLPHKAFHPYESVSRLNRFKVVSVQRRHTGTFRKRIWREEENSIHMWLFISDQKHGKL